MTNDLISRAALLEKECCGRISGNDVRNASAVESVSKAAYDDLYAKYCELACLTNGVMPPLINALQEFNRNVPPKKGEWIAVSIDEADPYFNCSVCLNGYSTIYHECEEMNYCPNCGASMKGDENATN